MLSKSFSIFLVIVSSSVALANSPLQLIENEQQIQIVLGKQTVLSYNKLPPDLPAGVEAIYQRSGFLHPVASPNGGVVTACYPLDHKHQNGIFSAWVKTTYDGQEVDFWNLAKGAGRTRHDCVVSTFSDSNSAGFVVELIHQTEGETPVDVLRETWEVTCHMSDGHHVFDIETTQRGVTDKPLVVEEYHYGGMALRGPSGWLLPIDQSTKETGAIMTNSQRSDRIKGNHEATNWVAMSGSHEGRDVCVAVFSHKDNFRSPQPARLHPTKPYFCFAACVGGAFVIDKQNPLHGRYRYIVTDGAPDADWLDGQWRAWCDSK